MFDNRPFQLALALSFLLHSFFLFVGLPRLKFFSGPDKKITNTEITYYKIRTRQARPSRINVQSQAKLKDVQRQIIEKTPSLEHKSLSIEQKSTIPDILSETLKDKPSAQLTVDLSNIIEDFKGKPVYLNYFQMIRENIRQKALKNYPGQTISGDITVSFVITSAGMLKSVRIIDEKSSSNQDLRAVAIQSIQEASPYPVFPRSFKQSEIRFNILISFKMTR